MPFLNIEIIGWATVAYIIYRWLLSFYKIIYPYLIAKPINLLEAAGSRWAGKAIFSLVFLKVFTTF